MIVADTSAILATIDPDATEHGACVGILPHLQRPMMVSHMVVAEVDYIVLAARHDTTVMFTLDHRHYRAVTSLRGSDAFTLLPADHDQWSGQTEP